MVTHTTTTRRHRLARRRPDYRRLAILFLCVVSIMLLTISTIVEHTSPFLVLIPTALGALMIARMHR
jgi:hypothetical protein